LLAFTRETVVPDGDNRYHAIWEIPAGLFRKPVKLGPILVALNAHLKIHGHKVCGK